MKKFYPLFIITTLILLCCGTSEKKKSEFKINTFIGNVKITSPSGERPAKAGEVLLLKDTITTGEASFVDIIFGDTGILRIYDNTNLQISSIVTSDSNENLIKLDKGKIFTALDKLKKNNSFKVKTPTTVVAVRGTSYRMDSTEENTTLEVVSGKVAVKPVVDDEEIDDAEKIVNEKEVVELDKKTAEEIADEKNEISPMDLEAEAEKDIQEDIKDIDIEALPGLRPGVRNEFRKKIRRNRGVERRDKHWWKQSKQRKFKMKALRKKRHKKLQEHRFKFHKKRGMKNDFNFKKKKRKIKRNREIEDILKKNKANKKFKRKLKNKRKRRF